jgi:hypothetical protein
MTMEEKCIIEIAVLNAFDFAGEPLTVAKEELEDFGFSWDDDCERYALSVLRNIGA